MRRTTVFLSRQVHFPWARCSQSTPSGAYQQCRLAARPLQWTMAGASGATTMVTSAATDDDTAGTSGHSQPDMASMMCNLLPNVGQTKEASQSVGIYIGEGLLPVPAKLAEKIARWEFVDMAELLPELWSTLAPKDSRSAPGAKQGVPRRRRTITDIATWVQCFATYCPHPTCKRSWHILFSYL